MLTKKNYYSVLKGLILLIGTVIIGYPVYLTVITGLKTTQETSENFFALPKALYFGNFIEVINKANFPTFLFNSILITGVSLVLIVILAPITSYAIARHLDNTYFKFLFGYITIGIFIPFQVIMIPLTKLMTKLHMLNQGGMIIIYLTFDVSSGDHMFWFMQLMKYGGALAAVPIGLATSLAIIQRWKPIPEFEIERSALIFSIILFGVGGIIGFMISGSDVRVTAHYHGSIVGVTLAFMGMTYHLLPHLGFRKVTGRAARWQPGIYGTGQLMHIIGLAWSGGYGVQRKTAGAEQGLEKFEQIAGMGLMGLGGLISIIGGVIFLVVVYKAMRPKKD